MTSGPKVERGLQSVQLVPSPVIAGQQADVHANRKARTDELRPKTWLERRHRFRGKPDCGVPAPSAPDWGDTPYRVSLICARQVGRAQMQGGCVIWAKSDPRWVAASAGIRTVRTYLRMLRIRPTGAVFHA